MADTSANVEHRKDIMRFTEEFVTGESDCEAEGEEPQYDEEDESDESPNCVGIGYKGIPYCRLRKIELRFDDEPADSVQPGLNENDVACPAVEEEEGGVGDAGEEAEEGLAAGEEDGEGGEGVGEDANTVGPGAERGAGVAD